jgi:hypothetical protein
MVESTPETPHLKKRRKKSSGIRIKFCIFNPDDAIGRLYNTEAPVMLKVAV